MEKGAPMKVALIKSFTDKPWRSEQTFQRVEDSLREKWPVTVIHVEDQKSLEEQLQSLKDQDGDQLFVFNIAEYLDEDNKAGFLPAMLDEWGMAHLGSSAGAIRVGLDKVQTKQKLLDWQIPTPAFCVAEQVDRELKEQAEKIGYPLFVKPAMEGGHIGINDDSIARNESQLNQAVERIAGQHKQAALVEQFISGESMREFSVGVVDAGERLYAPVEIDYEAMNVSNAILSHEVAVNDLEKIKLVEDHRLYEQLSNLAERTFIALDARDYSRVDIRIDQTDSYVLEINMMPGLGPHSFLPDALEKIYSLPYNRFIQQLTAASMKRQALL